MSVALCNALIDQALWQGVTIGAGLTAIILLLGSWLTGAADEEQKP